MKATLRATVIAVAAVMLLVPTVAADTCCANVPVGLDPGTALAGDQVTLIGIECRNADNSGPRPLALGSFWLATTDRAAEPDPDTTPGAGLPGDLPPVSEWLPFDRVPAGVVGPGDATITVPALPDGRYQLWWWCDDGSGPGGGIHYSTGSRLGIGAMPDTATAAPTSEYEPVHVGWGTWLTMAIGVGVLGWGLRYPLGRDRRSVGPAGGRRSDR